MSHEYSIRKQEVRDSTHEEVEDNLFYIPFLFAANFHDQVHATQKKMCLIADGVLGFDDADEIDHTLTQVLNMITAAVTMYPEQVERAMIRNVKIKPNETKAALFALRHHVGGDEIVDRVQAAMKAFSTSEVVETALNLIKSPATEQPDEATGSETS
jgi:hypothetical protein